MSNITVIEIPEPKIEVPYEVGGRPVDFSRGFDVVTYSRNRIGELVEKVEKHFDNYLEAEKFRSTISCATTLRYWLVPEQE